MWSLIFPAASGLPASRGDPALGPLHVNCCFPTHFKLCCPVCTATAVGHCRMHGVWTTLPAALHSHTPSARELAPAHCWVQHPRPHSQCSIWLSGKGSVTCVPLCPSQAYASADVILSGGAINSPQLLMLSGIGNADDLTGLGIPVVCHLPGEPPSPRPPWVSLLPQTVCCAVGTGWGWGGGDGSQSLGTAPFFP